MQMYSTWSTNWNIFRVTGPVWGESPITGGFPSQRPVTRIFDVLFNLLLNNTIEQTLETTAIAEAIALIMTSL